MPILARRKLLLVAVVVVFANCIDLATTYSVSPDLADEWNILQRHFNLGWPGLIGAKVIGALLAVLGYGFYLRHRSSCYPGPGADRHQFCRHFAFGRSVSWIEMQYRAPSLRHLAVNLGYFWAGMQLIVFWVALDNVLLRYGFAWEIRRHSELVYHLGQSAVVAAIVLLRFYLGNFRRYRLITWTGAVVESTAAARRGTPVEYLERSSTG